MLKKYILLLCVLSAFFVSTTALAFDGFPKLSRHAFYPVLSGIPDAVVYIDSKTCKWCELITSPEMEAIENGTTDIVFYTMSLDVWERNNGKVVWVNTDFLSDNIFTPAKRRIGTPAFLYLQKGAVTGIHVGPCGVNAASFLAQYKGASHAARTALLKNARADFQQAMLHFMSRSGQTTGSVVGC